MTKSLNNISEDIVRGRLARYSFYHAIEVLANVFTPGLERLQSLQLFVSQALQSLSVGGRRVLDIGCRDSLFSFQAEELGAFEVIGIDNDLSKGAVEFLIPYKQSCVRCMDELDGTAPPLISGNSP